MSQLPAVYTIDEIRQLLGIHRAAAYKLAKEGRFPVVRIGRRLVVPRKPFDEWLERGSDGS